MRFTASIFLLLQSHAYAGVGAFISPFSSQVVLSTTVTATFNHNHNKKHNFGLERRSYASSSSATKATLSSSNLNLDSSEIIQAAKAARSITSNSTCISSFGSIPYVNTSILSQKSQHRVVFVLGGPGAGKGTQSEKIVENYKCIHLSVGELLRHERQRGGESPHAELIESCLVAGKIVPVEISLNLLRNAMDKACESAKTGKGNGYGTPIFLVDGFPRNFDNLSGWTKEMPDYAAVVGSLVYDCPMDVLEQRILSRAATSGRSDDNLESARKRFKTFQLQTMPVVHALEEVERMEVEEEGMGKIHIQHIAAQGTVDDVWDATQGAMNTFVTNDVLTANALLIKAIDEQNLDLYIALCSNEFLEGEGNKVSVEKKFHEYEILASDVTSEISNASVEVQDGTKVVVTYDRLMKRRNGELVTEFRESRVWSHESKGWVCIHFVRKPLSES